MQAGYLVCSKLLGSIQHHCGEAGPDIRAIGREADVSEECLSIITLPAGLHDGTKELLGGVVPQNIRQRRQILMNHSAEKTPLGNTKHAVRSLICHQHVAIRVSRYDGCRAALDQDSQLLFRFEARGALMLYFMKVLQSNPAVSI